MGVGRSCPSQVPSSHAVAVGSHWTQGAPRWRAGASCWQHGDRVADCLGAVMMVTVMFANVTCERVPLEEEQDEEQILV